MVASVDNLPVQDEAASSTLKKTALDAKDMDESGIACYFLKTDGVAIYNQKRAGFHWSTREIKGRPGSKERIGFLALWPIISYIQCFLRLRI